MVDTHVPSFKAQGRTRRMEFRLLGKLEALADGQQAPLGPRKRRAILAVLLLHANEVMPAERLVELVWGNDSPRTAIHAVHNHVSQLRKVLVEAVDGPVIETVSPGYVLRAESASIDAARFELLVAEGRRAISDGDRRRGRESLQTALDMWRGEPLADFPYADFAQAERRRLGEIRLTALVAAFAIDIETGNYQDTIAPLQKVIEENPFREQLRMQFMTALYLAGRQTEALRAYQDFATMLGETNGMEPSPAMQELEDRILQQDPTLTETVSTSRMFQGRSEADRGGVGEPAEDFFGSAGVLLLDEQHAPRVGLLFLGRGNDRGYNDLAVAGLKRAVGALEIEQVDIPLAAAGNDWELRQAARAVGKGLLIVMGFPFQPYLSEVTPDFPEVDFLSLDHRSEVPSVRSIVFREQEGAFLVGTAAARKSATGRLGFLGGTRIAVIDRFLAGFVAGARHVDSGVRFLVDWVSEGRDGVDAFLSPSLGYEKGRALYEAGADVVMHAAGASGLGIFEAARVAQGPSPKMWAIGADSDQYLNLRPDLQPHVLTSMMKRCDIVMYEGIQSWTRGELESGSLQTVGLADGALGYSRSGGFVDDIASELDALAAEIISGELVVPEHYDGDEPPPASR